MTTQLLDGLMKDKRSLEEYLNQPFTVGTLKALKEQRDHFIQQLKTVNSSDPNITRLQTIINVCDMFIDRPVAALGEIDKQMNNVLADMQREEEME